MKTLPVLMLAVSSAFVGFAAGPDVPALVPMPRKMTLTGGATARTNVTRVVRAGLPAEGYTLVVAPQGVTVANLRLAVSETWKDQSGSRQERTEWVNVVLFRQLADLAQRFLRKGSKVYFEGKLQTRSWDDRATGQKRFATEVIGDQMQLLDRKEQGGAPAQGDGW